MTAKIEIRNVRGFCPMGCGETLFLAHGGYITCNWGTCPDPAAVSTILESTVTEHLVAIDHHSFNVVHPLRERVNNEILSCDLGEFMAGRHAPILDPGDYIACWDKDDGMWLFEAMDES